MPHYYSHIFSPISSLKTIFCNEVSDALLGDRNEF